MAARGLVAATSLFLGFGATVLAGCGGATGLEPVTYPLQARAVPAGPIVAASGWELALDDARVGFGPLYLCASISAAAELCPTAVGELAETVTVDLLRAAADPVELGRIRGVSDAAHSALYDYAITWRSGSRPLVTDAAPEGHALVLRGTARAGASSFGFEALLDVAPQQPGTYVGLARIPAQQQSNAVRLELLFDLGRLLAGVDFAALAARGQPTVTIGADDPAGNAIITALTADARPTFVWMREE